LQSVTKAIKNVKNLVRNGEPDQASELILLL